MSSRLHTSFDSENFSRFLQAHLSEEDDIGGIFVWLARKEYIMYKVDYSNDILRCVGRRRTAASSARILMRLISTARAIRRRCICQFHAPLPRTQSADEFWSEPLPEHQGFLFTPRNSDKRRAPSNRRIWKLDADGRCCRAHTWNKKIEPRVQRD